MHVTVRWVRGTLLGVVLAGLGAGGASAATTYYATPSGAGLTCTQAAPCDLATALGKPANGAGDVVQLGPGPYSGTTFTLAASDATLRGTPGAARPVITANQLAITGAGDHVSGVEISSALNAGSALLLAGVGSVAERVVAKTTGLSGASGCRIISDGITIRDSVCMATGNQGFALQVSAANGTSVTATVRNVVGYSGPNGAGLLGSTPGPGSGTVIVNASNSIFHSPFFDVDGSGPGGHVTITLASSDYVTTGGFNFTITPAGTAGNFTADPQFVGGGDFHLQAASPLVNAGTDSADNGPLDLDGQPRMQGAHTDIGAYERPAPPAPPPPPAPPGGAGGPGPGTCGCTATIPGATGTLTIAHTAKVKKGVAQLKLSCKGGACAGKLTLSAKRKKLGSRRYSLGAGKSATLKVKLSKAARRLLAKAHRHRLKVTVAFGSAKRSLTLSGR